MPVSIYGSVNANALTSMGAFIKSNGDIVAFTKTGVFSVSTQVNIQLEINSEAYSYASNTSVTMPGSPVIGTDYAIWAKVDGTLEATSDHTNPPATNARKIGGFHYAPGGNSSGTTGGDTTPQINEYSFWDLNFRPVCADPRGMTLVANDVWVDIYLTGVDAITNGSSKYNVVIADGSSPPKIPALFGGNGSTTYGSYTWFEAQELAMAFGKRSMTQQEFMAAAYGVTEATSRVGDPVNTILDAPRTSKWGLMQATGNLWVWSRERGGPFAAASWTANTEGRGSEYSAPNAALLGGSWVTSSNSGSRCSYWLHAASASNGDFGSRFACDHLQLV